MNFLFALNLFAAVPFPHAPKLTNDTIHQWAANTLEINFPNDKSGYYDICWARADKKTRSYVSIKYPKAVQNACAVVLNGAEW